MEKGLKIMEHPTKSYRFLGPLFSKSAPIVTTLYEMIEAVNEEMEPGEEHLVSLIVDHMLITGRVIQSDKKRNMYKEIGHG